MCCSEILLCECYSCLYTLAIQSLDFCLQTKLFFKRIVKNLTVGLVDNREANHLMQGMFTASVVLKLPVKTSILIMIVNTQSACKGKILKESLFAVLQADTIYVVLSYWWNQSCKGLRRPCFRNCNALFVFVLRQCMEYLFGFDFQF